MQQRTGLSVQADIRLAFVRHGFKLRRRSRARSLLLTCDKDAIRIHSTSVAVAYGKGFASLASECAYRSRGVRHDRPKLISFSKPTSFERK